MKERNFETKRGESATLTGYALCCQSMQIAKSSIVAVGTSKPVNKGKNQISISVPFLLPIIYFFSESSGSFTKCYHEK